MRHAVTRDSLSHTYWATEQGKRSCNSCSTCTPTLTLGFARANIEWNPLIFFRPNAEESQGEDANNSRSSYAPLEHSADSVWTSSEHRIACPFPQRTSQYGLIQARPPCHELQCEVMPPERFSKSDPHNQSPRSGQKGHLLASSQKATTAGTSSSQVSKSTPCPGRCANCVRRKVKCNDFAMGSHGPSCRECTRHRDTCAFRDLSISRYSLGPVELENLSSASEQGATFLRASLAGTNEADYAISASKNATQYTNPDNLQPYERKYSIRPGADLPEPGVDAQQETSHDDTPTPDDEQGSSESDSSTMTERMMGPESIRAPTATNDSPGLTDVGHYGTRTGLPRQTVVAIDEPPTMAPSQGGSRPRGSHAAPQQSPSDPGKTVSQADQLSREIETSTRSVELPLPYTSKWDLLAYEYLFGEDPSPTD